MSATVACSRVRQQKGFVFRISVFPLLSVDLSIPNTAKIDAKAENIHHEFEYC